MTLLPVVLPVSVVAAAPTTDSDSTIGFFCAVLYRSIFNCFCISSTYRFCINCVPIEIIEFAIAAVVFSFEDSSLLPARRCCNNWRKSSTACMYVLGSPDPLPFSKSPSSPVVFSVTTAVAFASFVPSLPLVWLEPPVTASYSILSSIVSAVENNNLYSSFAQTIQCTGCDGVDRIVHIGYTLFISCV